MNSQASEDTSQILKKALSNTRTKQEEQKAALESEYEQERVRILENINKVLRQHEKDTERLRKQQADRLASLLKRKMEIEGMMIESIEALRIAHDHTCEEVQTVVNGRINELEKK